MFFSGIINRLSLSDDEIAAIMGHEMAHALREHSKKAVGQQALTGLAASIGGAATAEIAAAVFLSEGTVRNYLSAAIGKLGARNRAEAIRTALDNGWI